MKITAFARSTALVGVVLGLLATGMPAAAQSTDPDVVRARATQLYLRAEDGLRELFDAELEFARARAANDLQSMHVAAGDMLAGATTAAYWSVVLDDRVNELGAREQILELSSELREITTTVYGRMADIVSTGDMDDLARSLDQSADGLTRLRAVVREIYDVIQANVTGQ